MFKQIIPLFCYFFSLFSYNACQDNNLSCKLPPSSDCHIMPPSSDCHIMPPSSDCHIMPPSSDCHIMPPSSDCWATSKELDLQGSSTDPDLRAFFLLNGLNTILNLIMP
jgi:hypothetical protein